MNIKSRLARLEKFNSKGLMVIVPEADFSGGDDEDCTYAIASMQEGEPFEAKRKSGEDYSDFRHRFVAVMSRISSASCPVETYGQWFWNMMLTCFSKLVLLLV